MFSVSTKIHSLSLHDALPIYVERRVRIPPLIERHCGPGCLGHRVPPSASRGASRCRMAPRWYAACAIAPIAHAAYRSEEHTSELQSLTNLVCRLLLEKKNKQE